MEEQKKTTTSKRAKDVLTPAQVAGVLKCSTKHVQTMVDGGLLGGFRLPASPKSASSKHRHGHRRVTRDALRAFLLARPDMVSALMPAVSEAADAVEALLASVR